MQVATAFLQTIIAALNWLVDNAIRLAEWLASAQRVGGADGRLRDNVDRTIGQQFQLIRSRSGATATAPRTHKELIDHTAERRSHGRGRRRGHLTGGKFLGKAICIGRHQRWAMWRPLWSGNPRPAEARVCVSVSAAGHPGRTSAGGSLPHQLGKQVTSNLDLESASARVPLPPASPAPDDEEQCRHSVER